MVKSTKHGNTKELPVVSFNYLLVRLLMVAVPIYSSSPCALNIAEVPKDALKHPTNDYSLFQTESKCFDRTQLGHKNPPYETGIIIFPTLHAFFIQKQYPYKNIEALGLLEQWIEATASGRLYPYWLGAWASLEPEILDKHRFPHYEAVCSSYG